MKKDTNPKKIGRPPLVIKKESITLFISPAEIAHLGGRKIVMKILYNHIKRLGDFQGKE